MMRISPAAATFAALLSFAALARGQTPAASAIVASTAKPVVASAVPAPARCRDAKGHFARCPTATAAKQGCRDDRGRFIACAK